MSKPKAFSKKDRDLLLRGAHYYIDQRRVIGEHWEEWQAVRRLLAAADPAKEAELKKLRSVYRAAKRWDAFMAQRRDDGMPHEEIVGLRRAIERAERKKK